MKKKICIDVLILGENRASLTAAIYCARANLKTLILKTDKKIMRSLEKSPDFISISNEHDVEIMTQRAKELDIHTNELTEITKVILTSDIKVIESEDVTYISKVILIADGDNNNFEISNESKFRGKGIYYNSLANINNFKDKTVAIIGDGHNDLEEALYVSKFAKKIFVIRESKKTDINKRILKEIQNASNIKIVEGFKLLDAFGTDKLEGVYLNEISTGKQKRVKLDTIIGCLGKKPSPYDREVCLEHRDDGYIKVNFDLETNIKGVFAIGKAINKVLLEMPTDINEANIVAMNIIKYLKVKNTDN
ncbi:MAG: NAD(P)/FAD-dependent oxidoreductase [Sarcina sp.]